MAGYLTSPDGKWMMTPDGWVFLSSDPNVTPDGEWTVLDGRFVHSRHLSDENIVGSVHLEGDLSPGRPLDQALVQTKDSVITGDMNVTVNQGPSLEEIKHLFVELLSQVGATTFDTPDNITEAERKLLSQRIDDYDRLISDGAESDPATDLLVATAAHVKGDYDDARRRLGELLLRHPDSAEANDGIKVLAQISIRLSDWDEAEKWVKQAMSRFETSGNWEGMIETYNQHAKIHMAKGEFTSAIEKFEAAVDIAKRRNLARHYALSLANLGFLLNQVGRTSEAKNALGESLPLARAMNSESVTKISMELSMIYESEGDAVNASRFLRESKADFSGTDDPYKLAERQLLEAVIQEKKNNLQMARGHYINAERMFSEIGVKSKQGDMCIALAELDDRAEQYDSAIKWYTKALRCFHNLPRQKDRLYCLAELGGLYLLKSEFAESIKNSLLAIDLAVSLGDNHSRLTSLINLCRAQRHSNNIAGAQKTLTDAETVVTNHGLQGTDLARLVEELANTLR